MSEVGTGRSGGAVVLPAPPALLALEDLAARLGALRLPLDAPGAAAARHDLHDARAQLADYVLPRYRRLDAPLLAVVGGSTGAGKSTLVNALVRAAVSRSSAIRPTTRDPVLVHHPDDAEWFADRRVLPGLARVHGAPAATGAAGAGSGAPALVLRPTGALPPGLALLDAPDVDSVVDANRTLAAQLLAAADLWLFVTTAARYADAVPWRLLRAAAARDTAVAVVLDRVPPAALAEVRADLRRLLDAEGLAAAPLLTVPETAARDDGLLPSAATAEVSDWLGGLAADAQARAAVVRRTLHGAVDALTRRVDALADAADVQVVATARLRGTVERNYADATDAVLVATEDGTMLRGEILARWQDFVGTGELFRSLQGRVALVRDRVSAFVRGRPQPVTGVAVAIEHGVAALLRTHADAAAERTTDALTADPAGRALLGARDLSRASAGFGDDAASEVRAWQDAVLDLVRTQGQEKRSTARLLAFGVNGVGVALMVVSFAATGGLVGAEIGIAGAAAVVGQKLLEAVFGDQAVRTLARTARDDLRRRCERLLGVEQARFLDLLDAAAVDPTAGETLRASAGVVRTAIATERGGAA